jgi:hypothetical protein
MKSYGYRRVLAKSCIEIAMVERGFQRGRGYPEEAQRCTMIDTGKCLESDNFVFRIRGHAPR